MNYFVAYAMFSVAVAIWAVHDDTDLFNELSIYPVNIGIISITLAVLFIGLGWPIFAVAATYRWATQSKGEQP